MPGFVAGGDIRYAAGLWTAHRLQLRELNLRKQSATSADEIEAIESMKTVARDELNRKLRSVSRSLF